MQSNKRTLVGIAIAVTSVIAAISGGLVYVYDNNSSSPRELLTCEQDNCFEKDFENDTEYRLDFPSFDPESSLYVSLDSKCPVKDEIESSDECAQIAKDYFHKPGAYRTNNYYASKCYYNINTNGTIHWNPYDSHINESPAFNNNYTSICKKSKI